MMNVNKKFLWKSIFSMWKQFSNRFDPYGSNILSSQTELVSPGGVSNNEA